MASIVPVIPLDPVVDSMFDFVQCSVVIEHGQIIGPILAQNEPSGPLGPVISFTHHPIVFLDPLSTVLLNFRSCQPNKPP